MPNIDLGEGRTHLKSENVYWTEAKASVPKEFVHDYLNPIVSKVVPKKPGYASEKSVFDQNMTLILIISIITQVIIEILALSLAENGFIFRYNHLRRGDYSGRTNFQNNRLALRQCLKRKLNPFLICFTRYERQRKCFFFL